MLVGCVMSQQHAYVSRGRRLTVSDKDRKKRQKRQTEKEKETDRHGKSYRYIPWQTGEKAERQRHTDKWIHTEREREREGGGGADRQTDRQRERDRERQRQREGGGERPTSTDKNAEVSNASHKSHVKFHVWLSACRHFYLLCWQGKQLWVPKRKGDIFLRIFGRCQT